MLRYALIGLFTLLVMVPLDLVFLGGLAKPFIQSQIGHLMGDLKFPAAILFYVLYAVGIVIFVNGSPGVDAKDTLLFGALFGLMCYATFELTSMSVLQGWTWKMVGVDIGWGCFVTATAATLGMLIGSFVFRKIGA